MAETRWLTDDEQAAWRAYLEMTALVFEQLDRELQRDADMAHPYYMILVTLSETAGRRLRMSELAAKTQSSRSRLSHAVARLEANGWVRREPCDSDRRGLEAVLTDKGFDVLVAAAPGHVAGVRRHLFDRLTPEQVQQLGEISRAVAAPLRREQARFAATTPKP